MKQEHVAKVKETVQIWSRTQHFAPTKRGLFTKTVMGDSSVVSRGWTGTIQAEGLGV